MKAVKDEFYDIQGASPLNVETFVGLEKDPNPVLQCLEKGKPCQVSQEVPLLLKEVRLYLGNAAAEGICSPLEMVEMHGASNVTH